MFCQIKKNYIGNLKSSRKFLGGEILFRRLTFDQISLPRQLIFNLVQYSCETGKVNKISWSEAFTTEFNIWKLAPSGASFDNSA